MEQTVALIDLFEKKFVIPHYQRGYRWEAQEVNELLDDLLNFEKTSNKGEFYCLQPIVLQPIDKDVYNVIDGQQRLTTLFLIVYFLEETRMTSGYKQSLFSLDYETRIDCRDYFEEKKFKNGIDKSNIDYFYISSAYDAIRNWFAEPDHAGANLKLIPILMDKNDKSNRNVRFIKYEVESGINPIDIFIRLNVGKIPLTDAELTKALLLQNDKYEKEELKFIDRILFEIATEWDSIEYNLQNDEFWYFLSNSSNGKPTHIEFIFDLIADKLMSEKKYFNKRPLKYATFLILSKYLQDLIEKEKCNRIQAVERVWEEVTTYYEFFQQWFHNRTLYHYIGFLIAMKGPQIIDYLINRSNSLTKKQFITFLEDEIGEIIKITKKRKDTDGNEYEVKLENLNYENEDQKTNDKPEINKILLLHNVYTSLKSEKEMSRFPFNLYKQTKKNIKWSLEHIHAQNSESIVNKINQKTWLVDHVKSLSNQNNPSYDSLIKRMKTMIEKDEFDQEKFDGIVSDVYAMAKKESELDEKTVHNITNLCLVDVNTNSKLNNSVFDVKREKIKEIELAGYYIPLCTRNVFLKAYTSFPVNNAYWTRIDREAYFANIKETYNHFVRPIKVD